MSRRERQIRAQIHQIADACLFAASFWIAFALRTNPQVVEWLNLDPIPPDALSRCRLALLPIDCCRALILESQGFYDRAALGPRRDILWPLFQRMPHHDHRPGAVMYTLHFLSPRL